MRRVTPSQTLRVASLFQFAAIGLLSLAGPARAADQSFDVVVTADSTRVMAGEKPIGDVQKGTRLTVSQTHDDWYLIDLPDTNPPQQGWIRKSNVQLAPATAITAQLTPDQKQERLKERDRYSDEARQLASGGKYDEAIAAAEQMLAIEQEVLGNDDRDAIGSRFYLATLHQAKGDFAGARKLCEEELSRSTRLFGKDHWQVTDARRALADVDVWARLKPADRRQLADADQLSRQAIALHRQGKFGEAVDLARHAADIRRKLLGAQHPSFANCLDTLARLYEDMGDYARAEPLYRQSLEIRKQALGERHPLYATSLNNLAGLYGDLGEYAKAEPLYRQAAETWKQALGERHPYYATGLDNLARLYDDMGDYPRAEPLYRQALEIRKQALGEKHTDYATSLSNLALLYVSMGDCAKAEPLLRQALEIRRQALGEKHPNYARTLANLAGVYQEAGKYAQAEPLFRQALEIRRQTLGEHHPAYAGSLSNLASLYKDMGDYAKAEPLCRQALQIRKDVFGEKHPEYASSLINLATLYKEMGDYAKAEPIFKQALEIQKQTLGASHHSYAISLNDFALLYEAMGDHAKAEPLYKHALQIDKQVLGEQHPDYAIDLNNLAALYKEMGDYARAEPLYRQASEIFKKVRGEKHPDYATGLNNLAELYDEMGDYAKAEPLYKQSLEIRKQALGEKHPDYAASLHNLAELYRTMGDFGKAEPLFKLALEIEKQALGEKHPQYGSDLDDLALLYAAMGDYVKAEPLCRQALQTARESLDLSAAVQSERQQLRMSAEVRSFLDKYLAVAAGAKTPAEVVYTEVLLWKGSVSARQQAIGQMRRALAGNAQPEVARRYEELAEATRNLANLYQLTPKPEQQEEHRRKLAALGERIEQLEQVLAGASQDFRQEVDQRRRTPADIRRALPPRVALVDLLEYDHYVPAKKQGQKSTWPRRLVAFIVRANQPVERIDLGPVEPIDVAIAAWRKDFGMGRGGETESPAQQLRRLVWEKVEPRLNGVKTVLLSPDGTTAQFPWPALPGKAAGSFLIEDTAIAIVPIPRMLPELLADHEPTNPATANANETPSLLLVGDVNFGADPTSSLAVDDRGAAVGDERPQWPSLPGTAAEVAAIKTTFESRYHQASPAELTQDRATKSAVLQQLAKCRYVHFSTHGYFAPAAVRSALGSSSGGNRQSDSELSSSRQEVAGFNPGLLSGLVLAGANRTPQDGKDDGILTALEVAGLDLSHVELATLSACETGLGESAGGEGLLGLQRAFQTAGARTVVASLWKVPDKATQTLMARFYDNLWNKKLTKLEALREAQRWLLREGAKQPDLIRGRGLEFTPGPEEEALQSGRLSPRYWAAFELSGDWR